jgi:hypothetical protein
MVGGWGTKKKKKKVSNFKIAKQILYFYDCVQLHQCSPSCVYVQLLEPPIKKSSRLAALLEGPSSHLPHKPDPVLVPPSSTPPPTNISSTLPTAPLYCIEETYVDEERMFDGREPSLEGDSFDDGEEENIQDADIEDLLGWPPKLLIMADEERRARKKHRAPAAYGSKDRQRSSDVGAAGSCAEERRRLFVGGREETTAFGEGESHMASGGHRAGPSRLT